MTKKEMAELEVWARARFESMAPELANFGLIDIAFNDQRMAEQLLREPSLTRLPINGDGHFGVKTACRGLRRAAAVGRGFIRRDPYEDTPRVPEARWASPAPRVALGWLYS